MTLDKLSQSIPAEESRSSLKSMFINRRLDKHRTLCLTKRSQILKFIYTGCYRYSGGFFTTVISFIFFRNKNNFFRKNILSVWLCGFWVLRFLSITIFLELRFVRIAIFGTCGFWVLRFLSTAEPEYDDKLYLQCCRTF